MLVATKMCLILIKGYDLGVDGDDSFEVYFYVTL